MSLVTSLAPIEIKSILQGIIIFGVSFGTYYSILSQNSGDALLARTMGLVIIILANLFLVLVNSSDRDFAMQSVKYLVNDKVMWCVGIGTIVGIMLILYTPMHEILKLRPLTIKQFLIVFGLSAVSVLWYELVKLVNKFTKK